MIPAPAPHAPATIRGHQRAATNLVRTAPVRQVSVEPQPPPTPRSADPAPVGGAPRTVTARQIARMLELPQLDPSASPVAVAQASAMAEVMGVRRLLCHPSFVRTAADALTGTSTGIAAPVGLDCAHTPDRTPSAAAKQAQHLVAEGATMIGLVWHATGPISTLTAAIRATTAAIAPAGATVRVALDTTAMTPAQIASTIEKAIDAGADDFSAGAWCTGRARLLDALRIKHAAPGCTITWAANLRDLDAVLLARSEGIDLVRGAADLIIRQALQREHDDGPIPLPWPGHDYLPWTSQLTG